MAALAPVPLIPARRPRSPDIIDVDALDDDDIRFTGIARRSVRPRLSTHGSNEAGPSSRAIPIVVLDSDEEMDGSGVVHRAPIRRRHRLRSPPPRSVHRSTPPPPVPAFPAHLRARHHHPPAIVPTAHPLPFETGMTRDRRRNDQPHLPSPRPAPRSHHQPVLGLGGALIALNRQNELEEQNRRRQEQEARAAHAAAAARRHRWISHYDWLNGYLAPLFNAEDHDLDTVDENDALHGFGQYFNYTKPVPKSVAWKPSYTHDDKPPPGFTYNFDCSDQLGDKGSSSSKAIVILDDDESPNGVTVEETATLVCASCMDTLVLSESLDSEESKDRRVWALRCGHMLDGKCVERLMRPPGPALESKLEAYGVTDKARADSIRPSRKGKGKAVDRSHLATEREEYVSQSPSSGSPSQVEENSIRSRLRSSRVSDNAAPAASSATVAPGVESPSRRRTGAQESSSKPAGRARGKGRTRKSHPLETYEFKCPVAGCGHAHRSILMPGEDWKMDPTAGAVALFV